mmetsp:Transcript_1511/g.3228  ORF Transcript_1511/g.3228 Transcript_1511/m.3228 type:complete len:269 (-) Transcript_1511:1039-1845(-)
MMRKRIHQIGGAFVTTVSVKDRGETRHCKLVQLFLWFILVVSMCWVQHKALYNERSIFHCWPGADCFRNSIVKTIDRESGSSNNKLIPETKSPHTLHPVWSNQPHVGSICTLQINQNKVSFCPGILSIIIPAICHVKNSSMSTTKFPIHNTQVRFVRPAKDIGTSSGVNFNQFPAHGSFRAMNGYFLFGFIEIFHIEHRITGGKRSSFAQDPSVRIERQRCGFSTLLRLTVRSGGIFIGGCKHFCFAHTEGTISSITTDAPSRGHSSS